MKEVGDVVLRFILVVYAGHNSWSGRSVWSEVQMMCSWIRHPWIDPNRRGSVTQLNSSISFVSSFPMHASIAKTVKQLLGLPFFPNIQRVILLLTARKQ